MLLQVMLLRSRVGAIVQVKIAVSPGPSCSKPDKTNPGLVEILIVIYFPLKKDFSQDKI